MHHSLPDALKRITRDQGQSIQRVEHPNNDQLASYPQKYLYPRVHESGKVVIT